MPKDFPSDKNMSRGDISCRLKKNLYVLKWYDNRPVYLASNFYHDARLQVLRRSKEGKKIEVTCPVMISEYNKYMGAVDFSDRLVELYGRDRRSQKKPWHRLFFYFLDLCLVNAYIAYKLHHRESAQSLLWFKKRVADELCQEQRYKMGQMKKRVDRKPKKGDEGLRYEDIYHAPLCGPRRRCWLCYHQKNIENRTNIFCRSCKVNLCLNDDRNCFHSYHSK